MIIHSSLICHKIQVSFEPRAKLGDWTFPSAVEHPFEILSLMFFRPSITGCDYQSPSCGVWVLASHKHPNGTVSE